MLTLGIGITQLDWLRWMNSRDGMLIDDLCAIASDKLDREVVKRSALTLKPAPVHKKQQHLGSVIANMLT
jgi:hypothetical protein